MRIAKYKTAGTALNWDELCLPTLVALSCSAACSCSILLAATAALDVPIEDKIYIFIRPYRDRVVAHWAYGNSFICNRSNLMSFRHRGAKIGGAEAVVGNHANFGRAPKISTETHQLEETLWCSDDHHIFDAPRNKYSCIDRNCRAENRAACSRRGSNVFPSQEAPWHRR